jgi:hypothetical protein
MMIERQFRFQVYIRWILAVFMVLSFLIPLATGLAETPNTDVGRVLPAVSEVAGESVQLNGKTAGPFSQSFKLDQAGGLAYINIVSDMFEFHGSYTPALRVVKSEFVFKNQDLIAYLGHDHRVTAWDGTSKIKVRYYLNNRLRAEKSFSDKGIVDSDIILFYLQGMLLKKTGDFQCELFGKKDGLSVNAKFRLVTTADFVKLAPEYNFPEGLRRISGLKNEVLVYIMELKGITRLFYGYKYYYVFEKGEPYRLIAYWGGPFREAEYGYGVNP